MTLILTELSRVGIAMAADSAISQYRGDGSLKYLDRDWVKLLKVPRIQAAVSYWGYIGKVTNQNFAAWLQARIDSRSYTDLSSFADFLALELNSACRNKPLSANECVGLHVAGYAPWQDGGVRPVFYHVHNGHGTTEVTIENTENGQTRLIPKWIGESRKLFEKHQDFPDLNDLDRSRAILANGYYLTRNGDYFVPGLIAQALSNALALVNTIPNVRVPREPDRLIGRLAWLRLIMETVIRIYRCSNLGRHIGGRVLTLGVTEDGRYLAGPSSA
jgi:hypothetical protein